MNSNKKKPVARKCTSKKSKQDIYRQDETYMIHLSQELINMILSYCKPKDLWSLMTTCKILRQSVVTNNKLWHEIDLGIFKHGSRLQGAEYVLGLANGTVKSLEHRSPAICRCPTTSWGLPCQEPALEIVPRIMRKCTQLESLRLSGFAVPYTMLGEIVERGTLMKLDIAFQASYSANTIIAVLPKFPNLKDFTLRDITFSYPCLLSALISSGLPKLRWGFQTGISQLEKVSLRSPRVRPGQSPHFQSPPRLCFLCFAVTHTVCELVLVFEAVLARIKSSGNLPLLPASITKLIVTSDMTANRVVKPVDLPELTNLKSFESNFTASFNHGKDTLWYQILKQSGSGLETAMLYGGPWVKNLLIRLTKERVLSKLHRLELWAGKDPTLQEEVGKGIATGWPELTTLLWRGQCYLEEATVRGILWKPGKRLTFMHINNTLELKSLTELGELRGMETAKA